uniref:Uncharacterized protein n=1 Tax=Alexandrium andersonii TaxID=327968 RepID=A0A7S2E157_9DINO
MFFILEHILCARHVVIRMQHIIEQQHKEGTMSQEDSHRIKCEVLRPSEVVLEEFIPGSKHLLPLDSPGAIRSKPLLDRFLFDLVLEQAKAH